MEVVKDIPRSVRDSKYDWADIFDGKLNKISKGKDFDCEVASFASNIRARAERTGVELVAFAIRGTDVYVQSKKPYDGN